MCLEGFILSLAMLIFGSIRGSRETVAVSAVCLVIFAVVGIWQLLH